MVYTVAVKGQGLECFVTSHSNKAALLLVSQTSSTCTAPWHSTSGCKCVLVLCWSCGKQTCRLAIPCVLTDFAVLPPCVLQLLDRHMLSSEGGGAQALGSLDSQLAETEDVLSYVSDLLSLGEPPHCL